ncbi:MAG TPA: class I SAM-dependent methyltransferase [Candidatus Sulfotelmatobacter sp.]|nr:class I SAM-dependent methyltransferase [Candidatus Sulfotelmatobacter sp.]
MDAEEYAKMAALEDAMWWYRGLRANLQAMTGAARSGERLLDAGCGTGGTLRHLRAAAPTLGLVGLEFDTRACAVARAKSGCPVVAGSIDALPFASRAFDLIVSADVLCHRNVDEAAALAELNRCLKPGGRLVLNLPAYGWLASAHDQRVHNVRRYTARGLVRLLGCAGFGEIRSTYWNTLLFPLMVLRRLLWRGASSDVMRYPAPLELLFRALLGLETRALSAGWGLPFGGSVLVRAVKHG